MEKNQLAFDPMFGLSMSPTKSKDRGRVPTVSIHKSLNKRFDLGVNVHPPFGSCGALSPLPRQIKEAQAFTGFLALSE